MNRNFLVPVDEFTEVENILRELARISTPKDSVHLLHVIPTIAAEPETESGLQLMMHDQASHALEGIRQAWLPGSLGTNSVSSGDPSDRILAYALKKNIDMIAMMTHGRGTLAKWIMGSVAREVVRKTQLPVLLARPEIPKASGALQKILVALEGAETPDGLLATVKSLAARSKAEILLFHAVDAVVDPSPQWAFPSPLSLRSKPEYYLGELAAHLEKEGYPARPLVVTGDAAGEILEACRMNEVDLVALATHGRTGLARLIEGSVAENVLRQAEVPVLLQRPLVARNPALVGGSHE